MKPTHVVQKAISWIAVGLLSCTILSPLQGENRAPEEVRVACEEHVDLIKIEMQRWASEGRPPHEIRDKMQAEFFPLVRAGKYLEAEKAAAGILALLKQSHQAPKPKDLSQYRRKTQETQYLILPIQGIGTLYGGQVESFDKTIKDTIEKFGRPLDPRIRNWGFHLMIPAWKFDPEHSVNKNADIARAVQGAFEVALRNDVAVHITVESHEWDNRADLWNYADKDKPGYDPENRANVEWSDWDGMPHPHRYRNWGKPEALPPLICYNSPGVLREVSRMINKVVAPPIKEGLERLKDAGKEHLFSGLTIGAEPALPNYENIDKQRPQIAKLMDLDGTPKTRLGYNALTNNGFSKANPPEDFAGALAQINSDYTIFWSRKFAEAGIPTRKMYTHVAAGAGVVGSPQVEFTNAPIEIAFNDYSRPGWTTYPVGPLDHDFEHLYMALAKHGNPNWASTEGGPKMGPTRGKKSLAMKDYLSRHFDYGATLIVFNTGATSKELSDSLNDGVWGEDAIKAYQSFLNP